MAADRQAGYRVALLAEGVDRNWEYLEYCGQKEPVALLAEGVDRNSLFLRSRETMIDVALLAEGVDRNTTTAYFRTPRRCCPPHGGRR